MTLSALLALLALILVVLHFVVGTAAWAIPVAVGLVALAVLVGGVAIFNRS